MSVVSVIPGAFLSYRAAAIAPADVCMCVCVGRGKMQRGL